MAVQSLPQVSSPNQVGATERGDRILNVARFGQRWFVELAPLDLCDSLRRSTGRIAVTPEVGRTMVKAAQRAGEIDRVHRWGAITTWHFRRGA